MTDQVDVLKAVARALSECGIAYMITGSTALGFYSQPRATIDVDVVADLQVPDADRLVEALGEGWFADVKVIRMAIQRREMFNLYHAATMVKVDFVVLKDSEYRRTEFARRRIARFEDAEVSVVSAEDLVLSKLLWGKASRSEMQRRDVRRLLALVQQLDWSYLESWAAKLGATEDLEDIRK